jgi:hypothetical protein
VVSTALKKLVGHPPCTLQDYFNKEIRSIPAEGTPKKRIKMNEEHTSPIPVRNVHIQKVSSGQAQK